MNRFIIIYLYVSHIYSINQCQTTFVTPPPFRLIYMLSYERNPTALMLSTILHPIKLYYTFLKMISSAAPVARAAVCHSTFGSLHFRDSRNIKKWRVHGNQLLFLDDTIHGFIPAGRRYHEGSVEGKKERVITSLKSENFSLRSQLAAEQSRYFKLEDAEVRQKIKTMETLEKKMGFIHRQRAVVSEQAATNMNGKRQSSGSWKWTKLLNRTEEINKAFANEVSWDPSSTSSTQTPTHRPSERTYGAI
ncbi:unnamed protein product [Brassica napus]|uniref:(rape) hypothetical protein n=1 Tax=Brassica napus TaxID=3708 RepID=A0A816Q8F5_BRANA|nr:unnamed protein product [Brassica napus]